MKSYIEESYGKEEASKFKGSITTGFIDLKYDMVFR